MAALTTGVQSGSGIEDRLAPARRAVSPMVSPFGGPVDRHVIGAEAEVGTHLKE
jgi:hypothetical protein